MINVRKWLAFPFGFFGVILLAVGFVIRFGLSSTAARLTAMAEGLKKGFPN